METNDFDQKLVEKIKEEGMAPKPRWHFLMKDYIIWALGTVSLLIGAAAVSVMIYLFKYSGWEVQPQTHKSLGEFVLLTLPYFWLIFLGLFVFTLYYNLKHTKRGYRYPVWVIIISSIGISIILGCLFFLAGLGEKVDDVLAERAPFYGQVINRHLGFWFSPEEGRLVGLVTARNDAASFNIQDPRGDDWLIFIEPNDFPADFLVIDRPVNLVGHVLNDNQFKADIVMPAAPGRKFFSRPEIKGRHIHLKK
jgi:heme/copper-type cytochrome/quinol oxidase subunit 2